MAWNANASLRLPHLQGQSHIPKALGSLPDSVAFPTQATEISRPPAIHQGLLVSWRTVPKATDTGSHPAQGPVSGNFKTEPRKKSSTLKIRTWVWPPQPASSANLFAQVPLGNELATPWLLWRYKKNSSVQNISRTTVENPDPADGIILGHFGGCREERERQKETEKEILEFSSHSLRNVLKWALYTRNSQIRRSSWNGIFRRNVGTKLIEANTFDFFGISWVCAKDMQSESEKSHVSTQAKLMLADY